MKVQKMFPALAMAAVISVTPSAVMAGSVQVSTNATSGTAQSQVTLDKTEEVVPIYTVEVPSAITLGRESTAVPYTLTLQDDTSFIPDGKKVSVKISSAGYPTQLDRFAVWNSRKLIEEPYQLYSSDRAANPIVYNIGDEIASWDGSDWGTIERRAKLINNYDQVQPGSYSGVINYTISLEAK